jgi:hypothetical protein
MPQQVKPEMVACAKATIFFDVSTEKIHGGYAHPMAEEPASCFPSAEKTQPFAQIQVTDVESRESHFHFFFVQSSV